MNQNSPAAIRAKIAEAKASPTQASLGKDAAKSTPAPNVEAVEVVFQCGHKKPVKAFKSEACPACRDKARQERAAKKREAQEKRRAAQADAGAPVLGKTEQQHGRLPDRTQFATEYDGKKQMWTGFLLTRAEDGTVLEFTGEASAVEWLLRALAQQYREAQKRGDHR